MFLEEVMATWRQYPELATLLGSLIGTGMGFRLSIAVDSRKEYNGAADPLRAILNRVIATNGNHFSPITDEDIDTLLHCTHRLHGGRIRKAVQRYNQAGAHVTRDSAGQAHQAAPEQIVATAKELRRLIGRR